MDLWGREDPEDRIAEEKPQEEAARFSSHEEIAEAIRRCAACHLRQEGNLGPVLSSGPVPSPLMLVGEGPGGVEDDYGAPLIGPSGQLLDKAALRYFLGHEAGIVRSRGHWIDWEGIPVMPTFHPAYLLRQYGRDLVQSKWDVYYDLREAKERAAAAAPDWVWQSGTPPDLLAEFAAVRAERHAGQ